MNIRITYPDVPFSDATLVRAFLELGVPDDIAREPVDRMLLLLVEVLTSPPVQWSDPVKQDGHVSITLTYTGALTAALHSVLRDLAIRELITEWRELTPVKQR